MTGAFGDTDTTTPNDSRYDALYNLLMLSGTSRTLQSFNNYPMGVAPSTAFYWLCQEHYDVYLANGGAAPGGTVIFDAGVVINAALAWSSAINLSTAQAPPYQQTPVQTARVLITERAICPLATQIQIPDAGNCYIESITGEPLLHLIASIDTKGNGNDGIVVNTTPGDRPPYVKLAGFSISKPFSYLTGWYDGVLVPSWSGGVLTSAPRNERDGSAGIWTNLVPYFAAPISSNLNAVIAMQQPNLPIASGGTGQSIVYFDIDGVDGSGRPMISTRTVQASATTVGVAVTIDPVTSAGTPLYYGAYQATTLAQLATYVADASATGLAGFNLRFLGLGALVVGGFQVATHGVTYTGSIAAGTGAQQGFGIFTVTSTMMPRIGTLLDTIHTAPGTAVIAQLSTNVFVVTVSQTVASTTFTTNNFQGLFVLFGPPPNPDANYAQGFNSSNGFSTGATKFPALLPKLAQSSTPQSATNPEREARPAIPGTEILFHTGDYISSSTYVHNGSPNDIHGSGVVINYPLFLRGHALNVIGDDFEVAINTYGFSQGQAYLNGGGGGWRVPRAISLYNDMRQDTGTFRCQDCYYADGTPGPMQLGSGAGSVHFASGDQPIEPQQAGASGVGFNRPIDLIIDGVRCWCPNAAAVAVVATGNPLSTQNRTSIRNSTLLSGAKTCAVNVKNASSTLSCQLYIENTDIDGWFQDSDGACGIQVVGEAGPANLTIGKNVRVLNAACQAVNCSGLGTIIMSEDFLAGQPQINVVLNRSSGVGTLQWTQIPNAVIACTDSLVAGEFQAAAALSGLGTGSPLQVGTPSQLANPSTGSPAINGNADYTRIRVRLTYVPPGIYAMVITNAMYPVIESAVGISTVSTSSGALGLNLLQTSGGGAFVVNAPAVNVCINSLHFQRLGSTPITKDSYSNYYTNTGDIWGPSGSPVTMVQSPAFAALLLA